MNRQKKNLIWVGTDDGNLQLTQNGGKTWTNVAANVATNAANKSGLPKGAWVSWVQASNFDAATAYAAVDRHTVGDMQTYVYRTRDFGKTWTALVSPKNLRSVQGYAHAIKEDLKAPNRQFLSHIAQAMPPWHK